MGRILLLTFLLSPFTYNLFAQNIAAPAHIDDRWGFVDETGNWIIKPRYKRMKHFSEGVAAMRKKRWGYLDIKENEVIPFNFKRGYSFSERACPCQKETVMGIHR